MTRELLILTLFASSLSVSEMVKDSVVLPDVEISVSRIFDPDLMRAGSRSVLDDRLIETVQITTPKEVASLVPNIHMPDHGSAMTSSIYIRGLGSRTGEPVLGLVVDGVPLLDKNMYDHTMQDVSRIEFLRGPQASLYGRNSPGGVMEIRTIQPLDLATTTVRGRLSYSTANSIGAQASAYRPNRPDFGWGIAARFRHMDGFYTNTFDNRRIDHGRQAGGRLVLDGQPTDEWRVTGTVTADGIQQGAFPYAAAATGLIDYNRPSTYERTTVMPSLRAELLHNGYRLLLVGSYQFMYDDMQMDQDYTCADIFTLRQTEHQHNVSFDAFFRAPQSSKWYEWTAGLSAFVKTNAMQAPVTFMREGIETIILAGANRGIQTVFLDDSLEIRGSELLIDSDFGFYGAGIASCYQSHFHVGSWHLFAGVRADYEMSQMRYRSTADTDYRFTMMMASFKTVRTELSGLQRARFFQVSPRLAVSYDTPQTTFYGYVAKGYKAGGYNPQIFSTVTQNQMMTDLAADMGMHLAVADPRFSDVSITSYKPETDWSFELGAHWRGSDGLKASFDVFHVQSFDQQVTVFPNGKTTGRMMANAARSRVGGVEAEVQYHWEYDRWNGSTNVSYGFANARFVRFNDGIGDYAGHVVPYVPRHTAHGLITMSYATRHKTLRAFSLTVKTDALGRIYWNEQNDCNQPFYNLLGVTLAMECPHIQFQLWGHNLTGTRYDVFYFRSMGNDFLQRGRPRELGVNISINL